MKLIAVQGHSFATQALVVALSAAALALALGLLAGGIWLIGLAVRALCP